MIILVFFGTLITILLMHHNMQNEYRIQTGKSVKITTGRRKANITILYSGMPNASTFALSPFVEKSVFTDFVLITPIIYYKKDSEIIHILDNQCRVVDVSQDMIVLQYLD